MAGNCSSSISIHEIREEENAAIDEARSSVTVEEESRLQRIISEVEADQDGFGTPTWVLRMMAREIREADVDKEELKEIFQLLKKFKEIFEGLDKDEDGRISSEALRHAMTGLHEKLITDEEVDEMIREADVDDDGQVNYDGFMRLIFKGAIYVVNRK